MAASQSSQTNLHSSPAPASPSDISPKMPMRVRIILLVVLLCVLGVGARMWWKAHYFEETDNAYLAGHVSKVSSRVSGVVTKVLISDNQVVRPGDSLIELDSADQSVRVHQIKAQIVQVDVQIKQAEAETIRAGAEAEAAQAQVTQTEAQLKRAQADMDRYLSLRNARAEATSQMEVDAAIAARYSTMADLRAKREQAKASKAKVALRKFDREALLAQKNVLNEQLREAELQLSYTKIFSPVGGRIGKKSVEVGSHIQPGQQLVAVVQDGVWVNANFKETQLSGIFVGQKAEVRIDAFPGRKFIGYVDSFSPASGAQFSLLPPDNATGNFTKIVQRIPVKIRFNPKDLSMIEERAAPGMSAVVEIDLRQERPAVKTHDNK